ncbi:DAK2 domain-containing protein [Jatrophihabitans fulvus]
MSEVSDGLQDGGAPSAPDPVLDAAAVRRWSRIGLERLAAHRGEIDALNVFPVADADTGSNLLQTLRAADDELTRTTGDGATAADALAAMASGAAWGAVGNSGFIVSQVLRGLADTAGGRAELSGPALADGLRAGAAAAHSAVVTPVEGTVLTVARAAAVAGAEVADDGVVAVAEAARAAAETALGHTTGQLADLAAHGVVDAGGRGYVVLLDALVRALTGTGSALRPVSAPAAPVAPAPPSGYAYEVQYRLQAPSERIEPLRARLSAIGDSVAVVPLDTPGTPGSGVTSGWKVHVHLDDVGAAIEAGVAAGRPHDIAVVGLGGDTGADCAAHRGTAVVAVVPGAGLAHLFGTEGVETLDGSGDEPPSAADLVAAIRATRAREIVLLPNASVATGVAEAAAAGARREGLRVAVVPTRSPVQGLAAIAVHDADRPFDDDVVAMAEAAAATRFAEVVTAEQEALTSVGRCLPGDVLGLIDGEVVEIGRGTLAVAFVLVDRLLGVGAELMTIVVGEGAHRRAGELVEAHIRGRAPLVDVTVYAGGQPDHPLIIGAE